MHEDMVCAEQRMDIDDDPGEMDDGERVNKCCCVINYNDAFPGGYCFVDDPEAWTLAGPGVPMCPSDTSCFEGCEPDDDAIADQYMDSFCLDPYSETCHSCDAELTATLHHYMCYKPGDAPIGRRLGSSHSKVTKTLADSKTALAALKGLQGTKKH